MILTCMYNRGRDLSDHQRRSGTSDQTEYPVSPGSQYQCLGMGLWKNCLTFLVALEPYLPWNLPAGLFSVTRSDIPPGWKFDLQTGIYARGRELDAYPLQALWGYPELIDDEDHHDALIEGEMPALTIFATRFAEAQQFHAETEPDY